jgi:hypothetical protein
MFSFLGASHPARDIPAPGSQAAQEKTDTLAILILYDSFTMTQQNRCQGGDFSLLHSFWNKICIIGTFVACPCFFWNETVIISEPLCSIFKSFYIIIGAYRLTGKKVKRSATLRKGE